MARELTYHRGSILSQEVLSPHLRRVVIGGDGIRGWTSSGVPDEALLVVVPDPATGTVTFPCDYPGDADNYDLARWYTVRAYSPDRCELTIDVVGHEVGLATRWSRGVRPGDEVGVSSTRHWFARPADAEWQVLLGDITALPAIGRILEERSDGVPTTVVVEIPEAADQIDLPMPAHADVRWVVNNGESAMRGLLGQLDLSDTPGYFFVAGEAKATRDVRRHLRHGLGLPATRYSVVGYWRARSEEWTRRYQEASIDLEEIYARGEANGADAEELADEVDRRLIDAGL